jgi:hypothetical protein
MMVNFKTGAWTDIGGTRAAPVDGLTWGSNGDLVMAASDGHIYRLPASVLIAAMKGGSLVSGGDWIDVGKAVTPSTVKCVPTTAAVGRDLQVNPLRSLPAGNCAFTGSSIGAMTSTSDTRYAPKFTAEASTGTGTGTSTGTGRGTGTSTGALKLAPADPTMTLPASANAPVSATLPGSAAASPSTFTVTDPGKLPPGVSIDASGNLMGIPSAAGTYTVPVKACNAAGCATGTGTVSLTIGPNQSPCDSKPANAATVSYRAALAHVGYLRG